jgi:hypothetical protein
MSEDTHSGEPPIGDVIALKIQELYRDKKIDDAQALLKIDNRDEAEQAPYQFDMSSGVLHRRGCKVIPNAARSALYGLWQVPEVGRGFGCPRCDPLGTKPKPAQATSPVNGSAQSENGRGQDAQRRPQHGLLEGEAADILYGAMSIVMQFRSVLRERGREYRHGLQGQQVGAELEGIYAQLTEPSKSVVDLALSSLDDLTRKIRDLESSMAGSAGPKPNGHDGLNGSEEET